jgi:hypothetical protein
LESHANSERPFRLEGTDDALAAALSPILRQLLRTLSLDQQKICLRAAVIGQVVDEEVLSRVTGFTLEAIRTAVNSLIELGIIEGPYPFHFRHRSLRHALCAGMDLNELGAIRYELATSLDLSVVDRAIHALRAPSWVGREIALCQSAEGRAAAKSERRFDKVVKVATLELELRGTPLTLEETSIEFELICDLAQAHESLGNSIAGKVFRERGLQLAEQEGRFDWSLAVVMTPPAHGRAIAPGGSVTQISRAIALAKSTSPVRHIARLRAERLHRLAICGAVKRVPEEEITWLSEIQPDQLGLDGWIEVLRARLCSDLAVTGIEERSRQVSALSAVLRSSNDIDLRADGLVLTFRNSLEYQGAPVFNDFFEVLDQDLLDTGRPMDRWLRSVLRCTALAAQGQLSAAYAAAIEARRLGAKHGISDSAAGWQLQSRQLLSFDPSLSNRFADPYVAADFEPRSDDDLMEGNLVAVGAAMEAQFFAKQQLFAEARDLLSLAESVFDPCIPDLYMSAAAACIAQACFVLNQKPPQSIGTVLKNLSTTSILVAMIPAWSLGPALRYSALVESLAGDQESARGNLLACAQRCGELGLILWQVVALEDALSIDQQHLGGKRASEITRQITKAKAHIS